MRTVPVDLNTHFGLIEQTITVCLLITPVSGDPEGYTALDRDLTISGVVYDSKSNSAPTTIPTRLSLNVDSADTRLLFGVGNFSLQRLRAGYYQGARFRMFAVNYEDDLTEQVTLMAGTLGQAEVEDDQSALVEMLSLASMASKPQGYETSPLCQCKRFGRDQCENSTSIGGDDGGPSIGDYTETGTVTHVTSAAQFRLSGLTSLTDWSDARFLGIVRSLDGDNEGAEEVVKSYDSGTGEITLRVPLPYSPAIGDTFDCERGCDRAFETCCAQPNREDSGSDDGNGNYRNFYKGYPFIPLDKATAKQN